MTKAQKKTFRNLVRVTAGMNSRTKIGNMKITKEHYDNNFKLIDKCVIDSNATNKDWNDLHERCMKKANCKDHGFCIPEITTTNNMISVHTNTGKNYIFRKIK
jgi:hypothetical protein